MDHKGAVVISPRPIFFHRQVGTRDATRVRTKRQIVLKTPKRTIFRATIATIATAAALVSAPTEMHQARAQSVDAALAAGRSALDAGDFSAALTAFDQAYRAAPNNRQAAIGLGVALDKLGRSSRAIAVFDRLIDRDAADSTARFYRGVARYRAGELNGAVEDYEEAIEAGAALSVVFLRLGDAHYAAGALKAALQAYVQATEADNPPAAAFRALGNARYALGEWRSADAAYSEALRGDPQDGRAAFYRAWTRERLGALTDALADYGRAIEIIGGLDPAVSTARADLLRRLGRYDEALADYQRAVELDPDHRPALHGAAAALLAEGRPGAAATLLDRFFAVDGQAAPQLSSDALRLRGVARLMLGAHRDAEADFSAALSVDPDRPTTLHNRAKARAAFGDLAGAVEDLRNAADRAPQDADIAYAHVLAAAAAGFAEEAAAAAVAAEDLSNQAPSALAARAEALLALGRPSAALSTVNQFLAANPRDIRALRTKIRILIALARIQEALQLSRRVIALAPRQAESHLLEAEARLVLKQPEAAREALNRANALGADPARIARLAGGSWLEDAAAGGGQPTVLRQAADALTAAVTLSNQSPETLSLRAAAFEKMGDYEQAVADLDLAVAADPQNAALRFQRAAVLRRLDRCEAAIRDLDAGLSLQPGDAAALSARAVCKVDQGRLLGGLTDYVASWF